MILAFACKMCGQCCSGKGGIIISDLDMRRICAHLRISRDAFTKLYAKTRKRKLEIKQDETGACVFFIPGKGCGVHRGKPDVCRAWPFFKGNLIDPLSLDMVKKYCPGINAEVSFEEFRRQGLQYIAENDLAAGEEADAPNALKIAKLR